MATSDSIAAIIGDDRAFAALQRDRLAARGIDMAPYALSHLAYRVADWDVGTEGYVNPHRLARGRDDECSPDVCL